MESTKTFQNLEIPLKNTISSIKYIYLVVDTSGSTNKILPVFKKYIAEFIGNLKKIDNSMVYISIVTYSEKPHLTLPLTNVKEVNCNSLVSKCNRCYLYRRSINWHGQYGNENIQRT